VSEQQNGGEPPLDGLRVADERYWQNGPPHEVFNRLRSECPVHWTDGISEFPDDAGFWSVTKAEHVHEVSRDWRSYSSAHNILLVDTAVPVPLIQGMFIGMDPPKHDRIKALFQRGFTPKSIAAHEDRVREIAVGVMERAAESDRVDLVADVAQPIVSRVIGSFMGLAPEDDQPWAEAVNALVGFGDEAVNPAGVEALMTEEVPRMFERCMLLIEQRRAEPTDDLMSTLVHAEIDGDRLSDDEIFSGFILLITAGNDSTKATYCSLMKALMENPDQREILLAERDLIPSAVEEALRMFPAFAHFRRTATADVELNGQQIKEGEKVALWYPSSNRDEDVYEDPHRFDVRRNPEHQAFGAGGRHFCLGTALARLELRVMLEETLDRFPVMEPDGEDSYLVSQFGNQLKLQPVKLNA
jgi:cytochrome P450